MPGGIDLLNINRKRRLHVCTGYTVPLLQQATHCTDQLQQCFVTSKCIMCGTMNIEVYFTCDEDSRIGKHRTVVE